MKHKKWMITAKRADFNEIARACGISPVLARLIRNRDVIGVEETRRFLGGKIEDLHDPRLLPDADKAVDILTEKIRNGNKIRIIGDYDVDGICSSFILWHSLRAFGGQADAMLPERMTDGYGINERLVCCAAEDGIDTIMTCDNGIAASGPLQTAKEMGLTVIVTDHHEVPYKVQEDGSVEYILPPADAVIDPKIPESVTGKKPYPFPDICGAVVAFKICQLYAERLWGQNSDKYRELVRYLLPFAGLATVCDVMPLADENRILVREGLGEASFSNNLGLQSLLTVNGLSGTPLTTYHAGFVIGPCLNATGRLDSAYRGLELFMEQNPSAALQSAQQLKELNDSRKSMTVEGTEAAEAMIESEGMGDRRVLVLLLRDCHESLAGIIAGRIKESRHRPTFVLTDTGNGLLKGSGRSIESYDMYAQMNACEDLFVKYGGHKMAGGLTMKEEDFEEFSRRIEENCTLTEEDLQEVVRVDMELPPRFLSLPVTRELDLLEPCGTQNPKPLFVTRNIRLLSARVMGKSRNVIRFAAQDDSGYGMELILFGDAQIFVQNIEESAGRGAFEDLLRGAGNVTIDMVYYPDINVWRDRESLQYIIKDYRIHN
ncbi:MAG: single-stranded-DNA-specific exonuclease RecJ [Lachnospiraceae bacterium]|nr:single-stranded-DNA-specific exonuclease RecJ [Lachnospiraceae bacterium]